MPTPASIRRTTCLVGPRGQAGYVVLGQHCTEDGSCPSPPLYSTRDPQACAPVLRGEGILVMASSNPGPSPSILGFSFILGPQWWLLKGLLLASVLRVLSLDVGLCSAYPGYIPPSRADLLVSENSGLCSFLPGRGALQAPCVELGLLTPEAVPAPPTLIQLPRFVDGDTRTRTVSPFHPFL